MDGWAVRRGDALDAEARLRIIGESAAGRGFDRDAGRRRGGAHLHRRAGPGGRRPRGDPGGRDAAKARRSCAWGRSRARPATSGRAAAISRPASGCSRRACGSTPGGSRWPPPPGARGRGRAAPARGVLSTGEEIVPAGGAGGPEQIFELRRAGAAAALPDLGRRRRAARAGGRLGSGHRRGCGGRGRRPAGHARRRLGRRPRPGQAGAGAAGARAVRWRASAMRPGKPTWFGRLADGRRVLGLPGNPASALVCAELFLRPVLFALQGLSPARTPLFARLAEAMPSNGPRAHYLRAELLSEIDGTLLVRPFPDQDSSLVSVFAHADALLHGRRRAGGRGGDDRRGAAAGSAVGLRLGGRWTSSLRRREEGCPPQAARRVAESWAKCCGSPARTGSKRRFLKPFIGSGIRHIRL